MSVHTDCEQFYCSFCKLTFTADDIGASPAIGVEHHGHLHGLCPDCEAELCNAGHDEACSLSADVDPGYEDNLRAAIERGDLIVDEDREYAISRGWISEK